MKKKQGFTLIELLIVVAIIGLLATLAIVGLTTAQQRARDAKRIADLRTLVYALELYFNENGKYAILDSATGADTWSEFGTLLAPYLSQIPSDPYHNSSSSTLANTYVYTYLVDMNTPATPLQYFISVVLESNTHQVLSQDMDGTVSVSGWHSITSKDVYDAAATSLSCDDGSTPTTSGYCLYIDSRD